MKLTVDEVRFLTALLREQNQSGCRGPAHDLLRLNAYPEAPRTGPNSLAFAYEAVPLTGLLLKGFTDLQALDDFVHQTETISELRWPWNSSQEYERRLQEARHQWACGQNSGNATANGAGSASAKLQAAQERNR
jgi:hypothetical protein